MLPGQLRSPAGRRKPGREEYRADRCRGDSVAKLQELAADPKVAQAGILARHTHNQLTGVIERKTLENLATSLSDGGPAFQMQRLAEVARAAIVVEGDYPELFRTQPGRGSWLADMLGRVLSATSSCR